MKYFFFILIILFSSELSPLHCQSAKILKAEKNLDQETYNEIVKELDLKKQKTKLKFKQKKRQKANKEYNFKLNGIGNLFSIIIYILIFALIGVIIYLTFSNIKTERKIEKTLNITDTEEIQDIEAFDTRSKYENALNAGDYRMAIRMQFLYMLQILSNKEYILWKPDKTNRDYSREIEDSELKKDFKQLSYYFEKIWYGNKTIDKASFDFIDGHFKIFIKSKHVQ